MIIEAGEGKDANSVEVIRECLGNGNRDFITAVDENSVIVVKEILEEVPKAELERVAKSIITTLEKEGASDVHIAYGSIVGELKEVSRSYKEAKMALDVGKIFFGERDHGIQRAWYRASDLSASDSVVQDVHPRDLW